ncbi:MAG TPA: hypothetical protein DEB70_08405 [Planctomycetaceae bacterium]|nr:hypothetical protein [Planctomycetaceae bacterium]|tara:strand:- start:146 stop:508 length:363 start_codon:yes stop_codon:yes gene_type:complete
MCLSLHPRPLGVAILKSEKSLRRNLEQLLFNFESLSVPRFLKYASSGPENGPKDAVIPKKGSLGALDGTLGRVGMPRELSFGLPAFFRLQQAAAFPAKYKVRAVSAWVSRGILLRCKNGE